MRIVKNTAIWTCKSCLRAQARRQAPFHQQQRGGVREFRLATQLRDEQQIVAKRDDEVKKIAEEKEEGAMSRRLKEMAEETMDTGSKSDRKMMADIGFSEDLKKQLEERIAQTAFKAQNQQAFAEVNMPSYAGQGTRHHATAQPWTGTETTFDASLRMLDDAHKKLRQPARIPKPVVDLRPATKRKVSVADRLVNARDKTSVYAVSQQQGLSEEERERMRKELKERFTPGARPMPTTLQGLTSLANERIEDAIARGQFRNINRGKGVNTERDYTANSPFLDTTEYFMNKIIQKQEIVPPWIEKQQELTKLIGSFRARLRNDWKRHAARTIASLGGSIDEQVRRAQGFALAEEQVNPRPVRREGVTAIDSTGNLTTITIEEKIAAGVSAEVSPDGTVPQPEITIKVTESSPEDAPPLSDAQPTEANTQQPQSERLASAASPTSYRVLPTPYPFRDPQWEATELAYQTLAIAEINSQTRSYNLMAPKVAQRPYHMLQRELNRCFAEVAPLVPNEILERSRRPVVKIEVIGHKQGGVMSKFDTGHVAKIRDEDKKKGYGFKEFWKDLFRKDDEPKARRRSIV